MLLASLVAGRSARTIGGHGRSMCGRKWCNVEGRQLSRRRSLKGIVMPERWEVESFCYLATRGRRTGRPHVVEIWFGAAGRTLYLLSGGGRRSDWMKNLVADPSVTVRIGRSGPAWPATARIVEDAEEGEQARRLLASKYQGWREGGRMSSWARTALPVALDLEEPAQAWSGTS